MNDLLIQFIIVGIILAGAIGWILFRLFFKKKSSGGSCCDCALSENCSKTKSDKQISNKKCPQITLIYHFTLCECLTNCHELTIFCQAIYAAGAIDAIGFIYAIAIHTASTVFFCPRLCPPDTASPSLLPMVRPTLNCRRQTTNAPTTSEITVPRRLLSHVFIVKLTQLPTMINSDTAHR